MRLRLSAFRCNSDRIHVSPGTAKQPAPAQYRSKFGSGGFTRGQPHLHISWTKLVAIVGIAPGKREDLWCISRVTDDNLGRIMLTSPRWMKRAAKVNIGHDG